MEPYRFVGLITFVAVNIYCFIVLHQIDRIEDKINKLLKAQTEPKKPKDLRKHSYDGYIGNCPSCDRVVRFAQKHCHNCTQLLDWIEVKNLPMEDDDVTYLYCSCCEFSQRLDNGHTICKKKPAEQPVKDGETRPEWCPLKEMKE